MGILTLEDVRKQKYELNRPSLKNLSNMKDIVGVEIGVEYGVNAEDILSKYDIKKLYLIDPYSLFVTVAGTISGQNGSRIKRLAHEYLKDYRDKIEWIEEYSWNVVDKIPDELDFIYIDGAHTKEPVFKDLIAYYPKVRSGGLFSGHDYAGRAPGVMEAVDEFFETIPEKLNYGGKWDWWCIKQ